jgi:hypothetical protein
MLASPAWYYLEMLSKPSPAYLTGRSLVRCFPGDNQGCRVRCRGGPLELDLPFSVALRSDRFPLEKPCDPRRRQSTISSIWSQSQSEVLRPMLHCFIPNLVPVLVKNKFLVIFCSEPSPLPEFAFELI